MILPRFDYQAPESIASASSLLAQADGRATIMAGGTDLLIKMKHRILNPELVVGLKKISELQELNYSEAEGLNIGSMVDLYKLATSAVINKNFPVLAEAAALVGAAQHQFMGTVGGNICLDTRCLYYNQPAGGWQSFTLCHKQRGNTCHAVEGNRCFAVYSADVGCVLFALGAKIVVIKNQGRRVVPIEEFFSGDPLKPTVLEKDDLITEIIIPGQKPKFARYYKLRPRGTIDFSQVAVAAVAYPEKKEYRIVINAVGAKPLRFKELEDMLSHDKLSWNVVADFISKVVARVKPVANVYGSSTYRRKMVGILLEKAFAEMGMVS